VVSRGSSRLREAIAIKYSASERKRVIARYFAFRLTVIGRIHKIL